MAITKAVILAGGMGTRLREETEFKPKPMVEIGGLPIIWHIMKNLYSQGVNDFVICLGYKGDQIKSFFENYSTYMSDVVIEGSDGSRSYMASKGRESWKITLADTGIETMTGGRINRVRKYLAEEPFLCTYGDGLADIDVKELVRFHEESGKAATVTAVHPVTRFGNLQIAKNGTVERFAEKPPSDEWVNGGFFIFQNEVFDYLDDEVVLEQAPLANLVAKGELAAYKHTGWWRPMDTYREAKELNELFKTGNAPWVNWQ